MSAKTYFYRWKNLIFSTGGTNNGIRDLLFRSGLFAMAKHDYRILFEVYTVIKQRIRWPNDLGSYSVGANISQKRMTRDPYWTFWAACFIMNKPHYIKKTKPPWYIWTPSFAAYRKYLLTRKEKYKRRYAFWSWVSNAFSFGKEPAFSIFLNCLSAWVIDSSKTQDRLIKNVPRWNLCCRQLILHPNWRKDEEKIKAYLPREGFMWQSPIFMDDRRLPLGQEYYLDKNLLDFVWNTNMDRFNEV